MPNYIERPTLHPQGFNDKIELPYDLRLGEVQAALNDIYDFLYNVNGFLLNNGWERLEEILSAATFSGVMSELVVAGISKRSAAVVKNGYHNGRPDLVPRGAYEGDSCHRGPEGIEVKASRRAANWQGHNREEGWLMLCQYLVDESSATSETRSPTRIVRVLCAHLDETDWSYTGRKEGSRRTPTATIRAAKLMASVVYADPSLASPTERKRKVPVQIVETTEVPPLEPS